MKYFNIILILLFLTFSSNAIADDKNKIFYLDIDTIFKETIYGKKILKKINELNTKNIKELKSLEEELKNKEKEIKNKENIISKDEFNKEINNLRDKINDFRERKNKLANDFNKIRNDKLKDFFKDINPLIQKYMDQNSIEILFDSKNIYIGNVNSDITKEIIKLVDNEYN